MTLEEMRKAITKDDETKDLKLKDDDVLKVYQYILMKNNQTDERYVPVLIKHPYIEVIYKPSEKLKEEMKSKELKRHLLSFDSSIYIQEASLSGFETYNNERLNAFNAVAKFLENYNKDHYEKGLYICGAYGTGKTYILSAVAHELAKRGIKVLFVSMPDAARSIREGFKEGNLEERINEMKQADILMLDDLGGESNSSWFRDEVLLPVLQYRLSAKKPIFISSNLNLKQLGQNLASNNKDEVDRIKAIRIIQRIDELTVYVGLTESEYTK